MKKASILIIGCGGLGCPVSLYCAGAGCYHSSLFGNIASDIFVYLKSILSFRFYSNRIAVLRNFLVIHKHLRKSNQFETEVSFVVETYRRR